MGPLVMLGRVVIEPGGEGTATHGDGDEGLFGEAGVHHGAHAADDVLAVLLRPKFEER